MKHRILILLLLLSAACSQRPVRPFPSYDLLVGMRQSDIIDLGTTVSIPWDHVFIFGPYSTDTEIRRIAGANIPSQVSESDGHCLLLFIHQGHATGYVEIERKMGDFSEYSGKSFLRHEARFRKIVDSSGWTRLKNE